ncbi:MAG TPA: DUF1707 domain-containing protein [Streptosporangiaceae bacterium]|nr:DUF1707 domain-containing protein [Streptosporangiaceae bacterium]
MTNGSGNTMPLVAAGQGLLRTSRADREHVVGVLQVAFVQGRLTQDEFEARIGQALASRTYSELSAVTSDLPALLIGSQLPRMPAVVPDKRSMGAAARVLLAGFVGLAVAVAAMALSLLTDSPLGLVGSAAAVVLMSVIVGTAMVESWDRQHDRPRFRLTP